jgi:transcriptional regulator with XRE-family HTH domain
MADFSDKLKVLMLAANLSGNMMAKLSGVPQTTISNYILRRNRPSWDHVQRIAKALGVSCTDLMDDEPEPKKKKKR